MLFKTLATRKILSRKNTSLLSLWCSLLYQCENMFMALIIVLILFSKKVFYALSICLSLPNLWNYRSISTWCDKVGILTMLNCHKFGENLHLTQVGRPRLLPFILRGRSCLGNEFSPSPQQATNCCPVRRGRDVEWNGEGVLVRTWPSRTWVNRMSDSSVLLFEDKPV